VQLEVVREDEGEAEDHDASGGPRRSAGRAGLASGGAPGEQPAGGAARAGARSEAALLAEGSGPLAQADEA
jgi:hypothetical protein